jgi:hypothetical protein
MVFQRFVSDADQERFWQGDKVRSGDRDYFKRLAHPAAQASAYFADAFNNTSRHHGYYPPASYHVTNVGSEAAVVIGNAVFYNHGKSRPGDEEQEGEEQCIDWMAMAACGYPGEDVKSYARERNRESALRLQPVEISEETVLTEGPNKMEVDLAQMETRAKVLGRVATVVGVPQIPTHY